jgi:hypothetical protein
MVPDNLVRAPSKLTELKHVIKSQIRARLLVQGRKNENNLRAGENFLKHEQEPYI